MEPEVEKLGRRVRALERWNRIWLPVAVGAALAIAFSLTVRKVQREAFGLSGTMGAEELSLHSAGDGPFLVTHVYYRGEAEGEKRVAWLPEPLMIVDSRGGRLTQEQMAALKWRDIFGQAAGPPPAGAAIWGVYSRMEYARTPSYLRPEPGGDR